MNLHLKKNRDQTASNLTLGPSLNSNRSKPNFMEQAHEIMMSKAYICDSSDDQLEFYQENSINEKYRSEVYFESYSKTQREPEEMRGKQSDLVNVNRQLLKESPVRHSLFEQKPSIVERSRRKQETPQFKHASNSKSIINILKLPLEDSMMERVQISP